MKDKLSILVVSSWYPSPEDKTQGCFVHEQVRMFQKRGHLVKVIKPNLNGSVKDTYQGKTLKSRHYQFEGVEVCEVNVNVYLPKLKSFYYQILQRRVLKIIREQQLNFDIIHSHSLLSAGIIASYLSKELSKPLFHTEHTSSLIFAPSRFNNQDKKRIKILIERATNVLFVSTYAKNNSFIYKDHLTNKICVLPNMVEDRFFTTPFITKKNKILVIGNFIEIKNHSFLLKVWQRFQELMKDKETEYTLVFAGNGFRSTKFKKLIEGMKNIEIQNHLSRKDVISKILESRLLLSASKLETFGLTIAEALALGTPVVVSDSGGPRDIIEQGDGFIVELGNVEAFAQKMITVLNGNHDTPDLIRKRCQNKFSEDIIYLKLMTLYELNS